MINRRGFLIGLIAAPAIVRITSIMPVKSMPAVDVLDELYGIGPMMQIPMPTWRMINMGVPYVKSS